MNTKQLKVGLVAALILGSMALLFVFPALSQGPALPPGEYDLEAGEYVFNVPAIETPVPTDTPVVPPTATPEGPWIGSPLCPSHNDRAYHGLFDFGRGCHFNHEHGMDPRVVDDIFGLQTWVWFGGEISYPWQTFKTSDSPYPTPPPPGEGLFENEFKHEGYQWMVARDLDCSTTDDDLCVRAFRILFHAVFLGGHTGRFHSLGRELLLCDMGDLSVCGIKREYGWVDSVELVVDGVKVPLPDDDLLPNYGANSRKEHTSVCPIDGWNCGGIWYLTLGTNGGHVSQLTARDVFGPVDPNDPFKLQFLCPDFDCEYNASNMEVVTVAGNISTEFDPDGDGIADAFLWVDRYGIDNSANCNEPELDCIPFSIEGAPVGAFVRNHYDEGNVTFDGDISPEGVWWIEYPN